jgi:aspartyl-tRNA(Asn)/glutamyl-tRNA(Gln) amidotransferase subunit B
MNQLAGREPLRENARALVAIINARDQITRDAYNASFASSTTTVLDVEEILNQRTVGEASELEPVIEKILDENPAQVESYRGGKQGVLGFFVGQVMKKTQGRADPKVVNDLLREKLNEQR